MAQKEVLESLGFKVVGGEENNPQRKHGERLREIRKQKGLTQEKLIEKLGIDTKTLSKIENGEGTLKGEAALKLYLEYGYSLDWVYGVTDVQDEKSPFLVDARDLIHFDNEVVRVTIKKSLYNLLKHLNSEKMTINLEEITEDYAPFFKGIAAQRRRAVYYSNDSECYYANIPAEEFQIEVKGK